MPPLQEIEVALADADRPLGEVIVTEVEAVQPFASVTMKVYVPAERLKVPVPVYGAVPPVAETVTVDVPLPQEIAVAEALALRAAGCVSVTEVEPVHPFASVTVNVYVPAERLKLPVPVYGAVPPDADTETVAEPPLQRMVPAEAATVTAAG